jgi:hypothetical protein
VGRLRLGLALSILGGGAGAGTKVLEELEEGAEFSGRVSASSSISRVVSPPPEEEEEEASGKAPPSAETLELRRLGSLVIE